MNQSKLTIKDLATRILTMQPITISVNGGDYFWSDDVDLTNVKTEDEIDLIYNNLKERDKLLNLDLIVTNISFDIVDYHHSVVRITTE